MRGASSAYAIHRFLVQEQNREANARVAAEAIANQGTGQSTGDKHLQKQKGNTGNNQDYYSSYGYRHQQAEELFEWEYAAFGKGLTEIELFQQRFSVTHPDEAELLELEIERRNHYSEMSAPN